MEDWTDWIQRVIGSVDDVREEWLGTPGGTISPDMPAETRQRALNTLNTLRELPPDQAQAFRQTPQFREAMLAVGQYMGKGRSKLERTVTDPYEASPFGLLEIGLPLAAGAATVIPPLMPAAPFLWGAAGLAAAPSVIPRGIQGAHDLVAGQLGDENVGELGDIAKVFQPSEWGPEAELGPVWDVALGALPKVPTLGKAAMKHDITRALRTGPRAGRRAGMFGGKDFYRKRFADAEKPWEYAPKFRDVQIGDFPKHYMPEYSVPSQLRRLRARFSGSDAQKALAKADFPVEGLSPWRPSTWADDFVASTAKGGQTTAQASVVAGKADDLDLGQRLDRLEVQTKGTYNGKPVEELEPSEIPDWIEDLVQAGKKTEVPDYIETVRLPHPEHTPPKIPQAGVDYPKPTQANIKALMEDALVKFGADIDEKKVLDHILETYKNPNIPSGTGKTGRQGLQQTAVGHYNKLKNATKWREKVALAKQGHEVPTPEVTATRELRDPTAPQVKVTPKANVFKPDHVPDARSIASSGDFVDPETGIYHIAEGLPDSTSNRAFMLTQGKDGIKGFQAQVFKLFDKAEEAAGVPIRKKLKEIAARNPQSAKSESAKEGIRSARRQIEDAINRNNPRWAPPDGSGVKGNIEPFARKGYWAGGRYVPGDGEVIDAPTTPSVVDAVDTSADAGKVVDDIPTATPKVAAADEVTDAGTPVVAEQKLVNWNEVPEHQILEELTEVAEDGHSYISGIKTGGRGTSKAVGKAAVLTKTSQDIGGSAEKLGIDPPKYKVYRRPITLEYHPGGTKPVRKQTVNIYKAVWEEKGLTSEWNNSPIKATGELDDALQRMAQFPDEGIQAGGKAAYIHSRGGNVEDFLYPQPGKPRWKVHRDEAGTAKPPEGEGPSMAPQPSKVQQELDANIRGDLYERTGLNPDYYTDVGAAKPLEEVAAGLRAQGWGEDNIEVFLEGHKKVLAKDAQAIKEGRDPGQERIQAWHSQKDAVAKAAETPNLDKVEEVEVAVIKNQENVAKTIADPSEVEKTAALTDRKWVENAFAEIKVAQETPDGERTGKQVALIHAAEDAGRNLDEQMARLKATNPGAHERLAAESAAGSPTWDAITRMGLEYALQQQALKYVEMMVGTLKHGAKALESPGVKPRLEERGRLGTHLASEFQEAEAAGVPPMLRRVERAEDEAREALIATQGAEHIPVTDDFLRNWTLLTPEQGKALQSGAMNDPNTKSAVEEAVTQVRNRLNAENQAARELATRYNRVFTLVQNAEMPDFAQIYAQSGSKKAFDAATKEMRKFYGHGDDEAGTTVGMMGLDKIPTKWPKGGAGVLTADLLMRMGGAAVGSTTGWGLYSEDVRGQDFNPQQQMFAALGLGVAGYMGPHILNKIAQSGDPFKGTPKARTKLDSFLDLQYFNILQSPDTIAKALGGAFGGTHIGALELFMEGLIHMNPEEVMAGYRVLRTLYSKESWQLFTAALQNPEKIKQMVMGNLPGRIKSRIGVLGMPGRAFTAGDVVAVNALKAGGFTTKESARFTLAGEPATQIGKVGLDWIQGRNPRHHKGERVFPGKTPTDPQNKLIASVLNMATLFPRVGILSIEGAITRTPGVAPAMKYFDVGGGLKPKTYAQGWAESATGAAALGVGYETAGSEYEPALWAVLSALGGPTIGLYALGYAARRGQQRPTGDPLTGALQGIREINPLGADPFRLLSEQFPQEIQRRIMPGLVSDTARALDPAFNRKTGPGELQEAGYGAPAKWMGQLIGATPLLRERLPETPAPVNVYGQPTFIPDKDRPAWFPKPLFPNPIGHGEPAMNVEKPELAWLADKGITLSPPQGNITVPGMGLPVETGGEVKSEMQAITGAAVEEAAKMVANHFKDLPPGIAPPRVKKLLQDLMSMHVRNRLEEAGIPLLQILQNPVQFIEAAETGQVLR
jgi:hypothetical protein